MTKIVLICSLIPLILSAGYRGGVYHSSKAQPIAIKKATPDKKVTFAGTIQKLIVTKGMRRGDVVSELQKYFSPKKIATKMIDMMKNGSVEEKIAAVYVASVLRNPKYEKYFKLLLKEKDLNQDLKRELIFGIGSNKFTKLNSYICDYLSIKSDRKLAIVAIRNMKGAICQKEIKKVLQKGEMKERHQILELLAVTGKYAMVSEVRQIFKKEGAGLKFSAALALTVMKNRIGSRYLIKQFSGDAYDQYSLYKNYRSIHEMIGLDNILVKEILLVGFKKGRFDTVQAYCGIALLFRGVTGELKGEIEELLQLHKSSNDMQMIQILAKYDTYLRLQQKKKKKRRYQQR